MQSLLDKYRTNYGASRDEEMSLDEYLDLCRKDPGAYATPPERMLAAIGEPELVDTRHDPRLSRLFSNRIIKRYPAFAEFYGMEDAISQIVAFFKHAAQGLEERKQILYLLGPVGGGKSSIAERLKQLMESEPIYALKGSPGQRVAARAVRARAVRRRARVRVRHPAPLSDRASCRRGRSSACRSSAATSRSSAWCASSPRCCARSRSPRPSRATRTTRTSPRWSARSTSASSTATRRTIRTPTATPAACAWPTRACSSSSRCSRRRSRCCTRC